jgi:hypothetical protein
LDQPLFLQGFEAVRDLVCIRQEQRPAPTQRDADLHSRKPPTPAEDNPAHCADHTATLFDKDGNGRAARLVFPFAHVPLMII